MEGNANNIGDSTLKSNLTLREKNPALDFSDCVECDEEHINSVAHQEVLELERYEEEKRLKKTAKSLCLLVQLFATENLSPKSYSEYYSLFGTMFEVFNDSESNFSDDNNHPLGEHSVLNFMLAQKACFHAIVQDMEKFRTKCILTGLEKRISIAQATCSLGTDRIRQILIATSIGGDGLPEDTVISAASIENFRNRHSVISTNISPIMSSRNIASLCTEEYESDLYPALLKEDNINTKLIHIYDFSNEMEKVLTESNSTSFTDVIDECKCLLECITEDKYVNRPIHFGTTSSENIHFIECGQNKPQLNFFENANVIVSTYLKNINVLARAMPSLIEDEEYIFSSFNEKVFCTLTSPAFLGKLVLLHLFFSRAYAIYKQSCKKQFSVIEYIELIKKFSRSLDYRNEGKYILEELYEKKCFKYSFKSDGKNFRIDINLNDIKEKFGSSLHEGVKKLQTNKVSIFSKEESVEELTEIYQKWLSESKSNISKYFSLSDSLLLMSEMLISRNEKVKEESFIKLFSLINTEFKKCRPECKGIENCDCLRIQFRNFTKHMKSVMKKEHLKPKDIKNMISYFLSESNYNIIKELNIINVLRVLEVIQIIKGSTYSKKKVIDAVSLIIERSVDLDEYYEDVLPSEFTEHNIDTIGLSIFLHFNNVSSLNVEAAAKKYLEELKLQKSSSGSQ